MSLCTEIKIFIGLPEGAQEKVLETTRDYLAATSSLIFL